MLRNVRFFVLAATCLTLGFGGALLISEQFANADIDCNDKDRYKEYCYIGNNAQCQMFMMSKEQCESSYGWYPEENFWSTAMSPGWHATSSKESYICANIYTCKWSETFQCLKDKYNSTTYLQIYNSVKCQQ